jgi:hypothetical protein
MLAANLLLDSNIESLRANEQRSLRFVLICGEIGAVKWPSYLEADLWRISSGLTVTRPQIGF